LLGDPGREPCEPVAEPGRGGIRGGPEVLGRGEPPWEPGCEGGLYPAGGEPWDRRCWRRRSASTSRLCLTALMSPWRLPG
jgi:hypothetical protein